MSERYDGGTWSLLLPVGWRGRQEDELDQLFGPDDVGAMTISAAFKDSEVLESDLRDFAAEHLEAGAKASPARCGDFVGFEIAFRDDDAFWRLWYLRNGRQMLFVTYSCDFDARGVEDDAIREALASLVAQESDLT